MELLTTEQILDMEKIVQAIRNKLHKATGEEHEVYESMAFDSSNSFGYGVRITMHALSQVLGKEKIDEAINTWLKQ